MRNRDGTKAELMLKTHKLERRGRAEGNLGRMTEGRRRSGASVHVSHFCSIKSTLPWDWGEHLTLILGLLWRQPVGFLSPSLFFCPSSTSARRRWDVETGSLVINLLFQDKAGKYDCSTEHCTRSTSQHGGNLGYFSSSFQTAARCDVTRGSAN